MKTLSNLSIVVFIFLQYKHLPMSKNVLYFVHALEVMYERFIVGLDFNVVFCKVVNLSAWLVI